MRQIAQNFGALLSIQVLNVVAPLATIPLVTRALGVHGFGEAAFAMLVMGYVAMCVDFGFSITATKKLSLAAGCRIRRSYIVCTTIVAQVMIFILLVTVIFIGQALVKPDGLEVMAAASFQVGSSLLSPTWLYQGLNKLPSLVRIQVASRLVSVPLIIVFINKPSDLELYLICTYLPLLIFSAIGVGYLWRRADLLLIAPRIRDIRKLLRSGRSFFFSKLVISTYTSAIPIVLGALVGPASVAHFSLADRFRNLLQNGSGTISQAYFPHFAKVFSSGSSRLRHELTVSLLVAVGLTLPPVLLVELTADILIHWFGGDSFTQATTVLRVLALIPLVVAVSSVASVHVLLASGRAGEYTKVTMAGAAISVLFLYPACTMWQALGAATLWLAIELVVCLGMWIKACRIVYSGRVK